MNIGETKLDCEIKGRMLNEMIIMPDRAHLSVAEVPIHLLPSRLSGRMAMRME